MYLIMMFCYLPIFTIEHDWGCGKVVENIVKAVGQRLQLYTMIILGTPINYNTSQHKYKILTFLCDLTLHARIGPTLSISRTVLNMDENIT